MHINKATSPRMNGAIPLLPQYDFMGWRLVKARGQVYLLPF
jgi:hypothetical protein